VAAAKIPYLVLVIASVGAGFALAPVAPATAALVAVIPILLLPRVREFFWGLAALAWLFWQVIVRRNPYPLD
jgi:hypothetical protein